MGRGHFFEGGQVTCTIPGPALERIEQLSRPEDHLLIFALYRLAAAGRRETEAHGRRVELGPGELAESQERLALAARTSRQSVRTSLARLEAAGLVALGRWSDQPYDEPLLNRSVVRVRLLYYAESIVVNGSANRSGGYSDPPFRLEAVAPAGRPARAPSDVARCIALFCRLWTEVRGGEYVPHWGRDGAAARRLLGRATLAEVEVRARRALADPFFQRAGSLAQLDARWSNFDGLGHANGAAAAPRRREVVGRDADGRPIYEEEPR